MLRGGVIGLKVLGMYRYITIFLVLLLSGCGPAYHLHKMKKHLNKAIEKGANLDTIKQIKHDTVYFELIRDQVKQDKEIDTVFVDTLCAKLKTKPKERKQTRTQLQNILCPSVFIDTVYTINLKAQGKEYQLPIRVFILSNGGNFDYKIESGNLKVPFVKEETNINISPKKRPTYWDLIIAVLISGLIMWAVGRLTKRK